MKEYTCYTRQGKWKLTADSDMDAMRTYQKYSVITSNDV